MKTKACSFLFLLFLFFKSAFAQLCGLESTENLIASKDARFTEYLHQSRSRYNGYQAFRSPSLPVYPIPVIFHFILSEGQLAQLGNTDSMVNLISRQIQIINQDFNANNPDSIHIPLPFKKLYGNAGIQFALARLAPNGENTAGFDLRVINDSGIGIYSKAGSGIAFSAAKYVSSGGLDAWDATVYLNVWVLNPLDSARVSSYLGLTVPPSFINEYSFLPPEELGVVISYANFLPNASVGYRTLTHEFGHYFELLHTWGNTCGSCRLNSGNGSSIADIPPQACPIFGCVTYPFFDACTSSGDGIMFMNYMDYTDGNCRNLFTKEQCTAMREKIAEGGESFGLTQHPAIVSDTGASSVGYSVYPNPSNGMLNIAFDKTPSGMNFIMIKNAIGQAIYTNDKKSGFYPINLSSFPDGVYFLIVDMQNQHEVRKIVLLRN